MSCDVGLRHGLDLALLWLWCRPPVALIRPLTWEPPYAESAALKRQKKTKKKKDESCHLNNMDGPWGYYAKWNVRQSMTNTIYFSHMWEYKKQTKINQSVRPSKNKYLDTENRVVVTRGEGAWVRESWAKEINCLITFANQTWACCRNTTFTCNLYNVIDQCSLNEKCILKICLGVPVVAQ